MLERRQKRASERVKDLPNTCGCVWVCVCVCTRTKLFQSCLTLCDPMGCSQPGSSVHGTLQARILEWVAMPSSRGSSQPRDQACILMSPALAGRFLTINTTWEAPAQPLPSSKTQTVLRLHSHPCGHWPLHIVGGQ